MSQLSGILFHVSALDVDAVRTSRRNLNVNATFERNRLIELRSLEVLGQVWVEIVLASKAPGWLNVAT